MAVAGNRGGAGGARNIARAQRRPLPGPPSFPRAVPSRPGALTRPVRLTAPLVARPVAPRVRRPILPAPTPSPGPRQRALAAERAYASQGRAVARAAYRQKPLAQRRAAVAAREPAALAVHRARERGRLAAPGRYYESLGPAVAKAARQPLQRPRKISAEGITGLGAISGAAHLADSILSGKATAGAVSTLSNLAGEAVATGFGGKVAGDWVSRHVLGLHPKKAGGPAASLERLAKGLGRDIVDLPANAIPSIYVPVKETVSGHPKKAAKELAQGAVQTVTHPLEHPLGALLTLSGAESFAGRGAGFAARTGALGETVKRAGATAREARGVPGIRATEPRPYSPDIIRKAAQVTGERIAARRAVKRGQPARRMTAGHLQRAIDDFVQTSRNVRNIAEQRTVDEVATALGGKRGLRRATAAHTVAVQGLTDATREDVQALLNETRAAESGLQGAALRANRRRQSELERALKSWDKKGRTERDIRRAQQGMRALSARQEQQMSDLGILDKGKGDIARHTPAAVRQGMHDPETAKAYRDMARDLKKQSAKEARKTYRKLDTAGRKLQKAREDARVSVARSGGVVPRQADTLFRALDRRDQARLTHQQAIADRELAAAHHKVVKSAPFIDRAGTPHTVQNVADRLTMRGQAEPTFLPHAYERQRAAVPEQRVNLPNPQQRTGAVIQQHTSPVSPAHLITGPVERTRLIEAAHARNQLIEHLGYREGGDVNAELARVRNKKGAVDLAGEAEKTTGMRMAPIINQDGTWSVIPKVALDRLQEHETITARTGVPDVLAHLGQRWRQAVLLFSKGWLPGQVGEGALRTAIHQGFNPVRLARSHRLVTRTSDELKRIDPQAAARFESLYQTGGAGRLTEQSRQEALHDFQMGESTGRLAHGWRTLKQRPSPRALGNYYGALAHFVFHSVNGNLETAIRRGMLGRELLANPIIRDRGIVVNFAQAAEDLANGLTDTAAQNRLARNLHDAFGQYQGRHPRVQQVISSVTPFIPWFLSSVKFLGLVLPRDHPMMTALIAAANTATQDERQRLGLRTSLMEPIKGEPGKVLPLWEQGGIPSGKGILAVSHYTPFGAAQAASDPASFLFPQWQDIMAASKGVDWRGYPIAGRGKTPSTGRQLFGDVSAVASTLAPEIPWGAHLAGVRLPHEAPRKKGERRGVGARLERQFNPLPKRPGVKQMSTGKGGKAGGPIPLGGGGGGGGGAGKIPLAGGGGGGGKIPL